MKSLEALVAPIVESMGFEFWGMQQSGGSNNALLRIYIDSENGVNVEDCAVVSRQLSHMLDVEDPISGEYRLEISSPGVERPFFTLEQYSRYTGEYIKVKLRRSFDGRRQFSGVLVAVENEELLVRDQEHEYALPYEWVDKGQVVLRD